MKRIALVALPLSVLLIAPAHADNADTYKTEWIALQAAYNTADTNPGFKTRLRGSSDSSVKLFDTQKPEALTRVNAAAAQATRFEGLFGEGRDADRKGRELLGKQFNKLRKSEKLKAPSALISNTRRGEKSLKKSIAKAEGLAIRHAATKARAEKQAADQAAADERRKVKLREDKIASAKKKLEDQAAAKAYKEARAKATAEANARYEAEANAERAAVKARADAREARGRKQREDFQRKHYADKAAKEAKRKEYFATDDATLRKRSKEIAELNVRLTQSAAYRGPDSASDAVKQALAIVRARRVDPSYTPRYVNAIIDNDWQVHKRDALGNPNQYYLPFVVIHTDSKVEKHNLAFASRCKFVTREAAGIRAGLPIVKTAGFCSRPGYIQLAPHR